jgi:hypothetical protein
MAITFTTQDVNVDETAGAQLGLNEITLAAFQTSDYAYLLSLQGGGAGDDAKFPQVAYNANFLSLAVPSGTTVADLVFTHLDSTNTQVQFSATVGFETTLKDVDGNTIYLFLDDNVASNGNVLIGRTANNPSAPAAFAIVLDEASNDQSAGAYVILYEAMQHNLDGLEPNDVIDLANQLYVSATTTTTTSTLFSDFSDVPSGNTDYAIIAPDPGQPQGTNILVTGDAPKGNVNSPVQNSTVNVSTQGLGAGSQAVGKNAVLQIDFINGGTQSTGSASQISYTSHLEGVTEAQFSLTQVNPTGELINLTVAAGDEQGNLQGTAFRSPVGTNVNIMQVQVFDAAGNLIEDSDGTPDATGPNAVTATINSAGDAVVTNLRLDYTVKVFSAGMDQLRITNTDNNNNASFDVGEILFGSTSTTVGQDSAEVGSRFNIYDDAPLLGDPSDTIVTFAANATATDTFAFNSSADGQALDIVGIPNVFTLADGRTVTSTVFTDLNGIEAVRGTDSVGATFYELTFDLAAGADLGAYSLKLFQDAPGGVNNLDFSALGAGGPKENPIVENIGFDGGRFTVGGGLFASFVNPGPGTNSDDINPNNAGGIGIGNGNIERLEVLKIDVTQSGSNVSAIEFDVQGVGGGIGEGDILWEAVDNNVVVASGSITVDLHSQTGAHTIRIDPNVTFDQLYVALDPADFDSNDSMRINRIATIEELTQDDILLGFRVNVEDDDHDQSPTNYQEFSVTVDGTGAGTITPDIIIA